MAHIDLPVLTLNEVEMLANLLQRAAVSSYEVIWVNSVLARLREAAINTGGDDDEESAKKPRV